MALLIGVITWYHLPGNPLYCDNPTRPLTYTEALAPWVAVDVGLYRTGWVECGDELLLRFADGSTLRARAWDAGPLAGYTVDGQAIVADVPRHLFPLPSLSATGMVLNLSAARREIAERMGLPDDIGY